MKAVFVMFTECTDPEREDEFNDWYSNIHIPDILTMPGIVGARRFRVLGDSGQWKYLAVYELDADDPEAAWANMMAQARVWSEQGRGFAAVKAQPAGMYEHIWP